MKWKYDAETANVTDETSLVVARIVAPSDGPLIAAAPDLLAALLDFVALTDWHVPFEKWTQLGQVTDAARAAIAQAEGGEVRHD